MHGQQNVKKCRRDVSRVKDFENWKNFWNVVCFIKSPYNLLNLKHRKPLRQEAKIQKDTRNAHTIILKKPLRLDHLKDRL